MPAVDGGDAPKPISADSHVCEPPDCYLRYIDPAYREDAPRVVRTARGADVYWIKNEDYLVPMPEVAAAGRDPREVGVTHLTYDDMYPGGWDPAARLRDQDVDGVAGEVVYPSVGMVLCQNPDAEYKAACMWAYNRWLQEFVAYAPDRLFGIGQTAVRTVAEAIEDFRRIREIGLSGVMLPAYPATAMDYDQPAFDPLWRAAVELNLPISFHILTDSKDRRTRGPPINFWSSAIRGVQDIIGMFIFGGVFERHPKLKLACVESDAGWVPHFAYRLDHIYNRHRFVNNCAEMSRLPSEQLFENVYFTFQDDWVALRSRDMLNPRRLMWANDYPHSDATWPDSQKVLKAQTGALQPQERRWILRDNVVQFLGLETTTGRSVSPP